MTQAFLSDHSKVVAFLQLLRPKQWVKNFFIFAPLIFVGRFSNVDDVFLSIQTFTYFCIGASCCYIFNDLIDLDYDKTHPIKSKSRPIASGRLTKNEAIGLLALLLAMLIALFWVNREVLSVIYAYILLNIAYSFVLKNLVIIDIFTIAIGFVLRVYAGAVALSVPVSSWMFVTVLCLALYLAAEKRRQELINSGKSGRKVLSEYSAPLIERISLVSAVGALFFYSLFVLTVRPELVYTVPVVLYGFYRYWYIVDARGVGESPTEALLSDIHLIMTVVVWVGICVWALKPGG